MPRHQRDLARLLEPRLDDSGRSIWKNFNWAVCFQVDDHRAIPIPLAKRDIIDSNQAQEANDWKFNPVKATQHRGRAGA
jgi:hypothetical protein